MTGLLNALNFHYARWPSLPEKPISPNDRKLNKMKNDKQTAESTAPSITSASVKEILMNLAPQLEIEMGAKAKCSAEQYGALIVLTLVELKLLAPTAIAPAMQAWAFIPKNPSAMRQVFENADKAATSPAVSSLIAKFLPPTE